jgi:outer membrane protein OmpA-like peptidoglycan-associated protein
MADNDRGNPQGGAGRKGDAARAERLRMALRENLKRRKLQARGRSESNPNRSNETPAHDSAGIASDKPKD